ncbi:hypothetical protein BC938DRAFT_483433, partial [Jimgerdemannia flammicorona]
MILKVINFQNLASKYRGRQSAKKQTQFGRRVDVTSKFGRDQNIMENGSLDKCLEIAFGRDQNILTQESDYHGKCTRTVPRTSARRLRLSAEYNGCPSVLHFGPGKELASRQLRLVLPGKVRHTDRQVQNDGRVLSFTKQNQESYNAPCQGSKPGAKVPENLRREYQIARFQTQQTCLCIILVFYLLSPNATSLREFGEPTTSRRKPLSSSALVIRSKTWPSSSDAASLTTGSSSAALLESSSSSSNPLYFESSVDASSTPLGAVSLLGASPLLHGLDDDEFEVDADINPITSETRSSDTPPPILQFPEDGSSPHAWMVPSGLSATEMIRGPKSIPSAHPSRFGIIRVGDGVRRLPWIKKADWEYLQASTNYHKHPISLSAQQFFNDLLQTDSLVEYVACVNRVRSQGPLDPQMSFFTDITWWFGESVFRPSSAFHTPRAQESVLGSLLIHTVFRLLANKSDRGVIYLPGEILLSASSARRAVRRNLGPEDEKPLGLKVDGFWQSPGTSDYEIGMLEISVGHLTNDLPRYLKDRVRGFWGMRDLLDYITGKLSKGDISIIRKLHVWFIHVYGHEIQVWSMDLPASRIYRMTCIGKISLPINWDNHHQLLHGLPILWNFGRGIESSIATLENLCKSNRLNSFLVILTPTKPKEKYARQIFPIDNNS